MIDQILDCKLFRESITHFLEKALTPAMTLQMERHRQSCDLCRQFLGEIELTTEVLGAWGRQEREQETSPLLQTAFHEWQVSLKNGDRPAAEQPAALLKELLAFSPEGRLPEVRSRPRYHLPELGEMVLNEAATMAVKQPLEAQQLAELGVEICRYATESETQDATSANDGLARALAVLANARRICSDFLGASEAFRNAELALQLGSGGPGPRAHLLRLRAQFSADCGRMEEAIADIDEAFSLYQAAGDSHRAGRALIAKGTLLGPAADPAEAVKLLRAGLALIDEEREPRIAVVAKHNLIFRLLACGSLEEALSMVSETRALHVAMGNRVDLVRFQWLEGEVRLEMGDLESAERSFLEVKAYFVDQGIAYDAALVSLDLAMVYLQQARTIELKTLAGEMVTIFQSLGIHRETFAALAFFRKALDIEQTATLGLLRELTETLERARRPEDFRPHLSVMS
jgi:tetratricopeptide (TPR) repeat protein